MFDAQNVAGKIKEWLYSLKLLILTPFVKINYPNFVFYNCSAPDFDQMFIHDHLKEMCYPKMESPSTVGFKKTFRSNELKLYLNQLK